jgi:amino-acid N-acetyltransferase
LLRSVAVDEQGRGTGRALVDAAIRFARDRGIRTMYLLTTTAEEYFLTCGFERVTRADVPVGVQSSLEFTSACPASAIVMRRVV